MQQIRIAQAQINTTVGDIAGNVALIIEYMERARRAGAHLVTFPELAICGYPPEDLLLKPRFLEDVAAGLKSVAEASKGIHAMVGFAEAQGGETYNAAALVSGGKLLGIYRKLELPNYGVFDEKRYFTPGPGCFLAELAGRRFMLTICEDLWTQSGESPRCAREYGAQVVLNISASPFHAGKLGLRRQILADFAGSTRAWVLYNNLVGGQDELVFDGGSLLLNPAGRLMASAKRFAEDLLVIDLELPPAGAMPPLAEGDTLVGLGGLDPQTPDEYSQKATTTPERDLGLVEEVYRALALGVHDYVIKNGFDKVVLGLSGGIDSSLAAAIAVDALGADNVVGVTMPSQYTSQETRGDAEALAINLGIKLITVPIEGILKGYLDGMQHCLGPGKLGVVAENLQARIRGNILMALSNRFGWLVLTTGNKSETAVGYCTLYGDMAGGFAVIKDVPKTLVYELSAHLNQRAQRELIPQSVIERPPSAELRPGQKDEDSLPPYDVLDPLLKSYVEEDKVLDEIGSSKLPLDVVRQVIRMVDLNEYKRRQAPPGVKITPKAFGKDRRLPITNLYRPGWK